MNKSTKRVLALLAAISFIVSGVVSQPASATAPSLTSVSPSLGTVSGGTSFTLTGTGFTGATGVTVGGVAATDFVVVSDTSITAKTPLRTGINRKIGKYPIVVQHGGGNSTQAVYWDYSPDLETANIVVGNQSSGRVILGDLASRTKGKPILRNATTPPLTVTGTDSVTGQSYSYIFERRSSGDFTGDQAYSREGIESTSTNLTTNWQITNYASRNNVIELNSTGNCVEPVPVDDYYCTIFGPDVYTQAFYAEQGQSISFDWAASDDRDAFEIYAFLVSVSDLTTIPTQSTANHTVATHAQGGLTAWRTESTAIPAAGYWRFRLVNGSYDETGGELIGARFYVAPAVETGLTNVISFGPFSDWVVGATSGATQNITVEATSDAKVTVVSNSTSVCTVDSGTHNAGTGVTTYVLTRTGTATGECQLKASQGSTGQYAPAADVFRAFTVRTAAVIPPTAPFISSLEPSDGAIKVNFVPPARNGGAAITNYEYQLNGGSWVALNPASTATSFNITGLTNGTTYAVEIRAVNSVGVSADSNTVSATPNVPAAPIINDYSATLIQNSFGTVSAPANTGGAIVTWSIAPSLPSGLTLNTSTGAITGSASALLSATAFTVTATNSSSVSDTAILTLTIIDSSPPVISYTTPITITVGAAGSATPTNTGGASSNWAITSGTLPTGLSLNATTGVISGTPTVVGPAVSVTIRATNPNGNSSATISIEIVSAPAGPSSYTGPILISINPSPLVAGQVQTATIFGERLSTLVNLSVNGKPIQIISRTDQRLTVTVPETVAGIYDLVAIYSGNATLTAQQFMRFVAGRPNVIDGKPPIRVVITGFRPGITEPTSFQTNRLKAAVARIDKEIVGLTCVGFTNGPRITPDDPRIALARGKFICDFMKELLPNVPQKLTYRNTTRPSVHWSRAEVYFVTKD